MAGYKKNDFNVLSRVGLIITIAIATNQRRQNKPCGSSERPAGFSLVGLLTAIGIISIVTMTSIPYLVKIQADLLLGSVAKDCVSDLRYAQQKTISEQIPHMVQFDLAGSCYQILKHETATSTIKSVCLPAGIAYNGIIGFTGYLVRFNSYGGVSESGEIGLINNATKTKTIYVKPSGYIQMH